jgi:predicted dehydrogenase/nucleoside-diphosphate-sugar epimerase
MDKLSIALIGCGKMGIHHVNIINKLNNARLVAVVDPKISKEDIPEINWDEVSLFNDVNSLYKSSKPDVVHIVTPPHTHFDMAKVVLQNGSHIYVEKPFAFNYNEAKEIIEIALQKGLSVCPGHQLLLQKPTLLLKENLHLIGKLVQIESYFSFRVARKSITPHDQIIDIMPHPVYTLVEFMNSAINNNSQQIEIKGMNADANGELQSLFSKGKIKGILNITLNGRPVDSYLKITGEYGFLYADYVRGISINLTGSGADAISAITQPYRYASQLFFKGYISFTKMFLSGKTGYGGLSELINAFYTSILDKKESPASIPNLLETVRICETLSTPLIEDYNRKEQIAKRDIENLLTQNPPNYRDEGYILITGGTGFLGRKVVRKLFNDNWKIRVVSRSSVPYSQKVAGVEYICGDLARGLDSTAFNDVNTIVHCAAETAGNQKDHERNSINASVRLMEAAKQYNIKRFIHISSIAVLKTSKELRRALDEDSPLDIDLGRGPYVWGKAKSEELLKDLAKNLGIQLKILRPGPLVDFHNFEAPGRLGREVATRFIVMGGKNSKISICDVNSIAHIINYYVCNFNDTPPILNCVEPEPLTRKELMAKVVENRKDLKPFYIPGWIVSLISISLKIALKIAKPKQKALDIKSAFSSEKYDTKLIKSIVKKSNIK